MKQLFTSAILTIGDELMNDPRDSNGPAIASFLNDRGLPVSCRITVPDELNTICAHLQHLHQTHDLVVCCGGLGPTRDDLTREAIARVTGKALVLDKTSLKAIQNRFLSRRWLMPAINANQAYKPKGAQVLANAYGTAPGLLVNRGGHWIAALPGPPRECLPMVQQQLWPRLQTISARRTMPVETLTLLTIGLGESGVQEIVAPLIPQDKGLHLGFLIQEPGEVLVKLTMAGRDLEKKKKLGLAAVRKIQKALGSAVVSRDGRGLEETIGKLLLKRRQTLAVAESCTGGWISSRLTAVPGSSRYFLEGLVTYSNEAKHRHLGVPRKVLQSKGAVSRETALGMAWGVKTQCRTHWGLAVTGIAGPGGGSRSKPVGTVHVALARPDGPVDHWRLNLKGTRRFIQQLTATTALNQLRLGLLEARQDRKARP